MNIDGMIQEAPIFGIVIHMSKGYCQSSEIKISLIRLSIVSISQAIQCLGMISFFLNYFQPFYIKKTLEQ